MDRPLKILNRALRAVGQHPQFAQMAVTFRAAGVRRAVVSKLSAAV